LYVALKFLDIFFRKNQPWEEDISAQAERDLDMEGNDARGYNQVTMASSTGRLSINDGGFNTRDEAGVSTRAAGIRALLCFIALTEISR
jgi:hypothetical protein